MKTFVVAYQSDENLDKVDPVLKKYSPNVLKFQESLWIIQSEHTPKEITDSLIDLINDYSEDRVFVCEIIENYDTSFGATFVEQMFK